MRYVNTVLVILVIFAISKAGFAGDMDAPAAPTSPGSAMYTLENIYNRLNSNTQATKREDGFTEPGAGPASTGHTLDDVYEKAIPTQVPRTGQTTSYATGDDGDLEKGVAWPSTRFTANGDGTVTDNLTGLIWLQNANCFGMRNWVTALTDCHGLNSGECDLSDGSSEGDWRLPNVKELQSLIDFGRNNPALPSGHPFTNVQSYYWSSSTCASPPGNAWYVILDAGDVNDVSKTLAISVWPVRGGQ